MSKVAAFLTARGLQGVAEAALLESCKQGKGHKAAITLRVDFYQKEKAEQ